MPDWQSHAELDERTVEALLREQLPGLAGQAVKYLKEGWDSRVYEVAGRWIVRFPKRAEVEQRLDIERALLAAIAPQLPLPVPRMDLTGERSSRFPFRFAGYAKLEGNGARQVSLEQLGPAVCQELAAFLGALHAVPGALARSCGVEHHGWRLPSRMRQRALAALAELEGTLGAAEQAACRAFVEVGCEEATATTPGQSGWRLLHNDLSGEHVLLDDRRRHVTGIIDWSDVEIGDPAVDFAGVHHFLGEEGTRQVLAAYPWPVDDALIGRARFFAGCVGLLQMSYGHAESRPEDWADGRRALALAGVEV
jgi:aminoglycoside phosphotransferase (APT) family kinase protein